MALFSRIPDRFFSILTSSKKELYVQALFVLRAAFKSELVIRQEDLAAMLMDSLEDAMLEADFTEEAEEEGSSAGTDTADEGRQSLSAKAHMLLRKLRDTGWIETEYESRSFEENITIPDYAIQVMNLLYDLSQERVREYNSYVYATWAALANAADNPDYLYQALQAAYQNTVRLIDELKTLFNNIRRYYQKIPGENDVNLLLAEHFDEYKAKVFDTVYYPLKTIDSVPRFKHAILSVLNGWLLDEDLQEQITAQGVSRRVFEDEETGRAETLRMISFVADTYDSIEGMLDEIDRKHNEYVNASIDHIRYLMNADRGVKGHLIELLKRAEEEPVISAMQDRIQAYRHRYYDQNSLYSQAKCTRKAEGPLLTLPGEEEHPELVRAFLSDVRRQYTNPRIDAWMEKQFGGSDVFSTEELTVEGPEDFILFLLATMRGRERSAKFTVDFAEGNLTVDGWSLPRAVFRRKQREKRHV